MNPYDDKLKSAIMQRPTPQNSLGPDQHHAYTQMESTRGIIFITGKAGTGKSLLLKYFVENTNKKAAVVAPTGMAAINIGGQTMHSFFHLAPAVQIPKETAPIETWSRNLLETLRRTEVIVIDEVSMVRVDLMDMIDVKLKMANGNDLPFGGKQVIMFGDLYQLPPVVEGEGISDYLGSIYTSPFFFSAPVFRDHPLAVHELTKVFRQKRDREFIDILNKIRLGTAAQEDLDLLNKRCLREIDKENSFLTLVPTNATADAINNRELRKIPPLRPLTYEAKIEGKISASEYPAPVKLELKVGAQVVMLDNNKTGGWVNGSLGAVSHLDSDFIRVKMSGSGAECTVSRKVWEKRKYLYDSKTQSLEQKVIATFEQYPVKLAWALTIHKAQGQTYESVVINMSWGAFAAGQTYVALSRCRSMDALYLTRPILLRDVEVDPNVAEFMRSVTPVTNMDDSAQETVTAALPEKSSQPILLTQSNELNEAASATQCETDVQQTNDENNELLSLIQELSDFNKQEIIDLLKKLKQERE
ncbi:MAG: AAA family ATPase [Chitinispirillales bacterium]|jgi:ATP-dependent exoDNAse (exonuclease V) alpha subunit|nr:AAA family ATPase [Chitinispirillales bacterium]